MLYYSHSSKKVNKKKGSILSMYTLLEKLNNLVNLINSTNSQKEKFNILNSNKEDEDIKYLFKQCYDPDIKFGISKKSLEDQILIPENSNNYIASTFKDLIEYIKSEKEYNKKLYSIQIYKNNMNNKYDSLIDNFFNKNLELNLNIKQINKVYNFIEENPVALAERYIDQDYSDYFIQRKLDGVRVLTYILYNKSTQSISILFKSRSNKEYHTLDNLKEEILYLYKNSSFYGENILLDGEVCIFHNNKEDWNSIVSEIKRKDHIIENPKYILFDLLLEEEYKLNNKSRIYSERYDSLKDFLKNSEKLELIEQYSYSKSQFDSLVDKYLKSNLWEGLILRKNSIYESGRNKSIIKYKLFQDQEYQVESLLYGEKHILINGVRKKVKLVKALQIIHKSQKVQVGSGLSDAQRIHFYNHPEDILNKYILVQYKQESKNENNLPSLQFPVLKAIIGDKRDY